MDAIDVWQVWTTTWQPVIEKWVIKTMGDSDPGHDADHVRRVVKNAVRLGQSEAANPMVVLPSAWLHDCIYVPKNSLHRAQASRLAAQAAIVFLESIQYPTEFLASIRHAIEAHSFSAAIECQTLEAQIVQDADRLEALGAIGLARCLMTGGVMGVRLYDPEEPFPIQRPPDDRLQSVDHFFTKLFRLPATMQTQAGFKLATHRAKFLITFLQNLSDEIGCPSKALAEAIKKNDVRSER